MVIELRLSLSHCDRTSAKYSCPLMKCSYSGFTYKIVVVVVKREREFLMTHLIQGPSLHTLQVYFLAEYLDDVVSCGRWIDPHSLGFVVQEVETTDERVQVLHSLRGGGGGGGEGGRE